MSLCWYWNGEEVCVAYSCVKWLGKLLQFGRNHSLFVGFPTDHLSIGLLPICLCIWEGSAKRGPNIYVCTCIYSVSLY